MKLKFSVEHVYEKIGEILNYDEAIRNKIHLELYLLKDIIK